MSPSPISLWGLGPYIDVTKPYKFKGFGAMDVTKPCKFIGFGAIDVTKPFKFIGFGAMDVTKPYKFIEFGAIDVTTPPPLPSNTKHKVAGRPRFAGTCQAVHRRHLYPQVRLNQRHGSNRSHNPPILDFPDLHNTGRFTYRPICLFCV